MDERSGQGLESSALASPVSQVGRRRSWLKLGFIPLALLAVVGAIYFWNYRSLQKPMNDVLSEDSRNEGISIAVRYEHYVSLSRIVLDVRDVRGRSKADVFRVLLQFAARMKAEDFDRVLLAADGTVKFEIEGAYFKELGEEFGRQNPIYTMRTFPSHVKYPDGSPAYREWTGGILAVMNKQLEEFNDFFGRWLE